MLRQIRAVFKSRACTHALRAHIVRPGMPKIRPGIGATCSFFGNLI